MTDIPYIDVRPEDYGKPSVRVFNCWGVFSVPSEMWREVEAEMVRHRMRGWRTGLMLGMMIGIAILGVCFAAATAVGL